jgi:O-antigen/teichoic acid export membrane protein
VIGQLVITLANFAIAPVILHYTSQILYGVWISALSILSYVALTDLGMNQALTRIIAGMAGQAKDEALNRVISTAFFVFCVAGAIVLIVGFSISAQIPHWFDVPAQDIEGVVSAYRIAVIAGALALSCAVFSGVVTGFQRLAVDNTVRNAVALVGLALSVGLLMLGWSLLALALSMLFTVVATAVLTGYYAWRFHPGIQIRPAYVNLEDFKHLIGFGGYFQLGRIANTVAFSSDNLVISATMGASHVMPYVFTSRLATAISFTVASKLPVAVFPAMSQMFAEKDFANLQRVTLRLGAYSARLAVVGAAVYAAVNQQFVALWVGPQQFGGTLLCAVFCYWILQDTISRSTTGIVFASGKLRLWSFASLAEAALNLAASLLLVRQLGLVGVALGTSIGKTLTTAWIVPLLICRSIRLSARRFIWEGILKPGLISLPSVVATLSLAVLLSADLGWLRLFVIGAAASVANFLSFEGRVLLRNPRQGWKWWHALTRDFR